MPGLANAGFRPSARRTAARPPDRLTAGPVSRQRPRGIALAATPNLIKKTPKNPSLLSADAGIYHTFPYDMVRGGPLEGLLH